MGSGPGPETGGRAIPPLELTLPRRVTDRAHDRSARDGADRGAEPGAPGPKVAEPQPKAAPQSLPRGRRKRRHETESDDLPAVLQEAGPGPARKRAGLTPAEMQRLVKGVRWEKESQQEYLARSLPSVSGVSATLGPDIFVFGRVECEGHLDLHGVVQGELQCESLSIAPEGKVEGSIVAQQVWIGGVIDGPVTADTVTLAKTARVNGSIFHRELHMEPGARHRGRKPWRLHPLENR